MGLTSQQKKLEDERTTIYGDPRISHRAIGYAVRGVLQNAWHHLEVPEITEDLMANIMQAFKVTRGARPVLHDDSYDDTHVYTDFGQRFKRALRDGEPVWGPRGANGHETGTRGAGGSESTADGRGDEGGAGDTVPVPVLRTSRDGEGNETSRSLADERRPKARSSRPRGGRSIRRRR